MPRPHCFFGKVLKSEKIIFNIKKQSALLKKQRDSIIINTDFDFVIKDGGIKDGKEKYRLV